MRNHFNKSFIWIFLFLGFHSNPCFAQWQPFNGPYGGGMVNELASNDSSIFSCTQSGLYTVLKGGNTWTRLNNGLPDLNILAFACTDQNLFVGTSGDGLYKSSDNGLSWSEANTGIADPIVTSILSFDSLIFVGTQAHGLYVSNDEGNIWNQAGGFTGGNIVAIESFGNILLVCVPAVGILVSNDFGNTWTLSNSGLAGFDFTSLAGDSSKVLVTCNTGNSYISFDTCKTWITTAGSYHRAAHIHGSDLFMATFGGTIKKSTNNGINWTSVYNTNLPIFINVSSFLYVDSIFYVGTVGAGVFRSFDNGLSWVNDFTGMKGEVSAILAKGNILYAGTNGDGIFMSSDGGLNWNRSNIGLTRPYINCIASLGTKIFVGTNGGLFTSDNFGFTWDSVAAMMNGPINSITIYDTIVYVSRSNFPYIAYSNNGGTNWGSLAMTFPGGCLTFSKQNSKIMAGARTGPFAYYSSDNGATFTAIPTTTVSSSVVTSCFANNFVFAGGSLIWRSSSLVSNWAQASVGWPNAAHCNDLFFDSVNKMYAAGSRGIVKSTDMGVSWQNFSAGLDYLKSNDISMDAGILLAATSNGVWWQSITTDSPEVLNANKNTQLLIHPNPSSGWIELNCNKDILSAEITIYDILGHQILSKQLEKVNGHKIDLSTMPSGVYFIQLKFQNEISNHKFIID